MMKLHPGIFSVWTWIWKPCLSCWVLPVWTYKYIPICGDALDWSWLSGVFFIPELLQTSFGWSFFCNFWFVYILPQVRILYSTFRSKFAYSWSRLLNQCNPIYTYCMWLVSLSVVLSLSNPQKECIRARVWYPTNQRMQLAFTISWQGWVSKQKAQRGRVKISRSWWCAFIQLHPSSSGFHQSGWKMLKHFSI